MAHSLRSPHSSTPLSPPSAKALRLIYCDESGMFRMDAEAVATLQLVKEPIGVVSVCGRARQGKSFILNQLLGRSSGFQVASTHRPCTKGLWMWSTPIKRTALDGTEYSLLLLDTEGVDAFDQTGTYSTQLFSLAVLLSSMFVYNQMGGIDEAALDQLSLVTEMTKHIRVRASENRPSHAELGQFSPIFLWLLRDFYLDLSVEDKRISPRDYLEAALQPITGQGKSITAKNQIRDSIKALFPDRDCFTLVRPLNDERDLQRLDQIPLEHMRPEFQSGLEALMKFIFERTKPKQLGSVVLNGPMLASLTQSFLDAFNAGAVPTIATSWQSVEESECRLAFDIAMETYANAFNECMVENEVEFQAKHQTAVADALNVYNSEAVGEGAARQKYEKLLIATLRKNFEESLCKVVMETELKCVNMVEKMDEQLWAISQSSDTSLEHALVVLIDLVSEYDKAASGPAKWSKFAKFLQNSLTGPLLGLTKRLNHQSAAEINAIQIKCRFLEDKLSSTEKQLDSSRKDAGEWKKRYESVLDQSKTSEAAFVSQLTNLQKSHDALEEKLKSVSHQHETLRKEASEWRTQYELAVHGRNVKEEKLNVEMRALQNRCSAADGRLAAAHEQLQSVKAEAEEWRRKYETATEESNTTSENATVICDRVTKQFQAREDALREEFSSKLAIKEKECKDIQDKLELAQKNISRLQAHLEDQTQKVNMDEEKLATLRLELKSSKMLSDSAKSTVVSLQKQLDLVNQENEHLEERIRTLLTRADEAEKSQRIAEEEKKLAVERAEIAREEALIARKEKLEAERLAAERLTAQEIAERRSQFITREKDDLAKDVEILQNAEQDTVFKVKSLDKQLEERDKEMKELLDSAHKQRAHTIHVLESLLESERKACADANARAEALSLQLQATQSRLDALQQELSTTHLNEAVLDGKLRMRHIKTPGKRYRYDDNTPEESVQNAEVEKESPGSQKKPFNSAVENGSDTLTSTLDTEIPESTV